MLPHRTVHDLERDFLDVIGRAARSRTVRHRAADLERFQRFIVGQSHNLERWPDLLFPLAAAEPQNSPVRQRAFDLLDAGTRPDGWWLKRLNPPETDPYRALVRTLIGHSGPVTAVVFTPDEKRAVSASHDHNLRLWEIQTGQQLKELTGHAGGVTSLAMDATGRRVFSGSHDGTVRVWDLESGRAEQVLAANDTWAITAVAVTADGTQVISGNQAGVVCIWDVRTGQPIRSKEGHAAAVTALAITPDGKWFMSSGGDSKVLVWSLTTHNVRQEFDIQTGWITAMQLSADGRTLLTAGETETRIWNLTEGELAGKLEPHPDTVACAGLGAHGQGVVTGCADSAIRIWGGDGQLQSVFFGHVKKVGALAVSRDGRWLLSGSHDDTLRLWDLSATAQPSQARGHLGAVTAIALSGDGQTAVSAGRDGKVICWDVASGTRRAELAGHSDFVSALAVSADGRVVASGGHDRVVRLRDLSDILGGAAGAVVEIREQRGWVNAVALSAKARRAIVGYQHNVALIWDFDRDPPTVEVVQHTDNVSAVAMTPDGRVAVSAGYDMKLVVRELGSDAKPRVITHSAGRRGPGDKISALAVAPNGRFAVTAVYDAVSVWNLQTGERVAQLQEHKDQVTAVAVSSDGRRILSAGLDRLVLISDAETGKVLARFPCDFPLTAAALARGVGSDVAALGDGGGNVLFFSIEEPAA